MPSPNRRFETAADLANEEHEAVMYVPRKPRVQVPRGV